VEKIKIVFKWIWRNLFFIIIAIFLLFHMRWFQIAPTEFTDFPGPDRGNRFGLFLLIICCALALPLRYVKAHNCLRTFLAIPLVFFMSLDFLILQEYMPTVGDTARYNGTSYYIIYYGQFLDPQWRYSQLTKRHGLFNYESHIMPNDAWGGKFIIDEKMNAVNIVTRYGDFDLLVYTDSKPPREYERSVERFEDRLIYIATKYNSSNDTYTYTLYKCEQDNTSCVHIPFEYMSGIYFPYLQVNQTTGELDFYIGGYPNRDSGTLVYSYGDHPRCYVEGCKILSSP
jgi:hypothetical protein